MPLLSLVLLTFIARYILDKLIINMKRNIIFLKVLEKFSTFENFEDKEKFRTNPFI